MIQATRLKPVVVGADQHHVAVLLHKTLQDQRIVVATLNAGDQFIAHALGIGAAHVVAFQQHLIAAAHAHQPMAQLVEARVGVGAQKQHGQHRDQQELGDAQFRDSEFRVSTYRFHQFRVVILSGGSRKRTAVEGPLYNSSAVRSNTILSSRASDSAESRDLLSCHGMILRNRYLQPLHNA